MKSITRTSPVLLIAILLLAGAAFGQARTYRPQVRSYTPTLVIEGRVSAISAGHILIKTARGRVHKFLLDDQLTILGSGELVSVATMDDITLGLSDLRPADRVEVVFERLRSGDYARIITRVSPAGDQVAKR